jgi:hypothetical protein
MQRLMLSLVFCFGMVATAQTPAASAVLPVELQKSLDSKKVKVGDEVQARTTADLMADGKVVVPRGAKVLGKVTAATARNRGDGTSSLAFTFDRVEAKGGHTFVLDAAIQAIAAPVPPPAMAPPSAGGMEGPSTSRPSAETNSTGVAGSTMRGGPDSGTQPAGQLPSAAGSDALLTPQSTGIIGLSGVQMNPNESAAQLSSDGKSVKLESGTRILLRVMRLTPAAAKP